MNAMETLIDVFNTWGTLNPDTESFRFISVSGSADSLTYSFIRDQAGRFAARLRKYDFKEGDIIGNSIPNSPERLISDLGIICAGCATLNCEVTERFTEIFWSTAKASQFKGLILTNDQDSAVFKVFKPYLANMDRLCGDVPVIVDLAPTLTKLVFCNRDDNPELSFLQSLEMDPGETFFASPKKDDMVVVFVSKDKHGATYLIPRSHAELITIAKMYELGKFKKFFKDSHLGWIGGFFFENIYRPATRVLMDYFKTKKRLSSFDQWSLMSKEKCQAAFLLPQAILELIHFIRNSGKPGHKLRMVVTGGQTITQGISSAIGLFTDIIKVVYFASEIGLVSSGLVTAANKTEFKSHCCGQPLKTVEIRIVNEKGETAQPYDVGSILVKSPIVMKAYANLPSEEFFTPDGFFKVGDRGYLDDHGNLYNFGRGGDVMRVGKQNIYASHIRGILHGFPDIQRNYVVAMKDKAGKEKFYACIMPVTGARPSKELLVKHCQMYFSNASSLVDIQKLDSINVQEFIEFLYFENLPEAENGKVQAQILREMIRIRMGFDL